MAAYLAPDHLARALELQSRLWTHARIAADLGVHRTTVSRSLSRHNRRTLERMERRTAAAKGRQVDQLERMADEAFAGWERSQRDVEALKITSETVAGVRTERTETSIRGQAGDPSFLREAREILADVRKILGLDAPPVRAVEKPLDDDFVIDLAPDPEPETDSPYAGDGSAT